MTEAGLLLIIPIILALWPVVLLRRWRFFAELSILEKTVVSLSCGTAFLTLTLVYAGLVLPSGFKAFSQLIFLLLVFMTLTGILEKREGFWVYFALIGRHFKKIPLLFLAFFAAYFAKVLLFLLFKPIIDPDAVNLYFPFARSIFLADKIPLRNFYDTQAMMVPPIGVSALYAWVYSLAGSIQSEAFRLMMVPFLVGNALLTYLISRIFLRRNLALLATSIFLFLTIQDELLFEFVYYADTVFAFLSLAFFYFLLKFFEKGQRKLPIYGSILLGVTLGATWLFKFQAIFLVYFFIAFFWLKLIPQKNWAPLSVGAILLPFLATFYPIAGFTTAGFNRPSLLATFFLLALLFLSGWLVFLNRGKISIKAAVKTAFITTIFVLPGFVWLARNILLFRNPFVEQSQSVIWAADVGGKIGILPGGLHPFAIFSLLLLPTAGTLWLIPKLSGFMVWLQKKRYALVGFWLVSWFCFWIFYLGAVDVRYLLAALPALSVFIILGLEKLFGKDRQAILVAVLLIVIFSLAQSLFLWWNLGYLAHGSAAAVRQQALESLDKVAIDKNIPTRAAGLINQSIVALNSRGEFYPVHAPKLAVFGILVGVIAFLFAKAFAKKIKSKIEGSKTLAIFLFLILFSPYLLVFWLISEGDLRRFAAQEQLKVYNFKGQVNFIVPYLERNLRRDSVIAVYGVPSGLAYITNRPTWHLEYGRDLAKFEEIFNQEEPEKISQFYQDHKIDFFLVDTTGLSWEHFNKLKQKTRVFDILENPKYFTLVVEPNSQNAWALYQINSF